jgi:hypothetical protein
MARLSSHSQEELIDFRGIVAARRETAAMFARHGLLQESLGQRSALIDEQRRTFAALVDGHSRGRPDPQPTACLTHGWALVGREERRRERWEGLQRGPGRCRPPPDGGRGAAGRTAAAGPPPDLRTASLFFYFYCPAVPFSHQCPSVLSGLYWVRGRTGVDRQLLAVRYAEATAKAWSRTRLRVAGLLQRFARAHVSVRVVCASPSELRKVFIL